MATSSQEMLGYSAVMYAGLLILGAAAGNEMGLAASGFSAHAFLILGAFAGVRLLAPEPSGASQGSLRSKFSCSPALAGFWLLWTVTLPGIPAATGFFGR